VEDRERDVPAFVLKSRGCGVVRGHFRFFIELPAIRYCLALGLILTPRYPADPALEIMSRAFDRADRRWPSLWGGGRQARSSSHDLYWLRYCAASRRAFRGDISADGGFDQRRYSGIYTRCVMFSTYRAVRVVLKILFADNS
jgi:hypothetical protein